MNKDVKKSLIIFGIYLLIAMATGNWHYERYPSKDRYADMGDSILVGMIWPFYWTFKLVDVIVCPEPVYLVED